jgi:hypothetical protein
MGNLVVQIGYTTSGGGIIHLAISRDQTLAARVGRHILDELSETSFDDDLLNKLAKKEYNHFSGIMSLLDSNHASKESNVEHRN